MNNLRSKLSNLKNACHIFRHYLRWPYPMPVRMSTVLHLLPLRKCRRTTTVTKQVGTLNCVLWRPTNEIERISSAL